MYKFQRYQFCIQVLATKSKKKKKQKLQALIPHSNLEDNSMYILFFVIPGIPAQTCCIK